MTQFLSVDDMLEKAGSESLLDTLSPEMFVAEIADQLVTLSDAFDSVTLRVSHSNIARFCTDLRAGQKERAIEEGVTLGHDRDVLRELIDPDSFDLPRRIETYAAFYPSVELTLSARTARLLGGDLARGIALRTHQTDKETPSC